MQTRVVIRDEIRQPTARQGEWCLAFQKVRYIYASGDLEDGYRFIWYRADGSLQAARGQARIGSVADALWFIQQAVERGWNADDARARLAATERAEVPAAPAPAQPTA
jgi:hypothetical protein